MRKVISSGIPSGERRQVCPGRSSSSARTGVRRCAERQAKPARRLHPHLGRALRGFQRSRTSATPRLCGSDRLAGTVDESELGSANSLVRHKFRLRSASTTMGRQGRHGRGESAAAVAHRIPCRPALPMCRARPSTLPRHARSVRVPRPRRAGCCKCRLIPPLESPRQARRGLHTVTQTDARRLRVGRRTRRRADALVPAPVVEAASGARATRSGDPQGARPRRVALDLVVASNRGRVRDAGVHLYGVENQQPGQPDAGDQQPQQRRESDLSAPGWLALSPHEVSCRRNAALPLGAASASDVGGILLRTRRSWPPPAVARQDR